MITSRLSLMSIVRTRSITCIIIPCTKFQACSLFNVIKYFQRRDNLVINLFYLIIKTQQQANCLKLTTVVTSIRTTIHLSKMLRWTRSRYQCTGLKTRRFNILDEFWTCSRLNHFDHFVNIQISVCLGRWLG